MSGLLVKYEAVYWTPMQAVEI